MSNVEEQDEPLEVEYCNPADEDCNPADDENCHPEYELRQLLPRKLKAVEIGHLTDVKFLVGTGEDNVVEELHAFKSDLVLASEVFRAMLTGPFSESLQDPIKIKEVEPWHFRNLLVAVHSYGYAMPSLDLCLHDVVELGMLADKYLAIPVVEKCVKMIRNKVDVRSVWVTLNRVVSSINLRHACDKILMSNTRSCLADVDFNDVSEEALVHFLQLDEMDVDEEFLVKACLELNDYRTYDDSDDPNKWIKIALPHLRLLTLPKKKKILDRGIFEDLAEHLTADEQRSLAAKILFKGKGRLPGTLCSIKRRRKCN